MTPPTTTGQSRERAAGSRPSASRRRDWLPLIHGAYWVATGIWPLLHRASFEWIVGPKTDFWLAETVGLLVAAIGATLLLAGRRGETQREIIFLAGLSALVLAGIDLYYAGIGRIRAIYLADAVVEAVLVTAWIRRWRRLLPRNPSRPA